jgi:hypothetical protein
LGLLLDSEELQDPTPDSLSSDFCLDTDVKFEDEDIFPRAVSYVLRCIVENMYEAQQPGRIMLRHLVGEEAVKDMIDYAELGHCQEACCAGAA